MEISQPLDMAKVIKDRIHQQRIYGVPVTARANSGRRTGGLNGGQRRAII